jgi:hypothetical protein
VPLVAVLQGADNLNVEPGQRTTCQLSLANTGSIVEQFTILFLGDVAEWTTAEPPVISLFPGAQQTATITFAPPRLSTTVAGAVPFAVKVIPSNEPEESVTEEGVINVGGFTDLGAELLPRQVTGRVSGRQKVAIDSRGNIPLPVTVTAIDAADALKFKISPAVLTTAPGAAHFVKVRIRPRKRFWRGPPKVKPFQVQVAPENQKPLALDASYSQRAVLPSWVYLVAGIAAALALLWFLVLKPAVHNTAVNANKQALAAQQARTAALQNQVAANRVRTATNSAAIAALAVKGAKKSPAPTTTTSTTSTTTTTVVKAATTTVPKPTTTTTAPPVTGPNDGRVDVIAPPGSSSSSATPPVPAGTTMTITDLILQNVSGATAGTARVQRVIPGQGTQDLLVQNLGGLDNQEFMFNTPIVFTHDQQLQLSVDCATQTACEVGLYFTGPLTEPATATTTTIP